VNSKPVIKFHQAHESSGKVNIEKFGNILKWFGPIVTDPAVHKGFTVLESIKGILMKKTNLLYLAMLLKRYKCKPFFADPSVDSTQKLPKMTLKNFYQTKVLAPISSDFQVNQEILE
jgi:hypothetical protein